MHKKISPLADGISAITIVSPPDTYNGDIGVVAAARISKGEDIKYIPHWETPQKGLMLSEKDRDLIWHLARNQHTSPFEHNHITFRVTAPIFVARHWMRHRIGWSYNELSRRYTSEKIRFYIPGPKKILAEHSSSSLALYRLLMDVGMPMERARMVLPLSTYTQFYATCNFRSAMHFIALRDRPEAQWETVQYASAMRKLIREIFPVSMEAWEKEILV